jgi:predicted DCC family thiol-disulfide oxidoreductase YuxK
MASSATAASTATESFVASLPANLVLYDGECMFCNTCILFAIRRNQTAPPERRLHFLHLQEPGIREQVSAAFPHISKLLVNLNSIVLLEKSPNGKCVAYVKSAAALRIGMKFDQRAWRCVAGTLYYGIPSIVANVGYDVVARYRYKIFGKNPELCARPPKEIRERAWKSVASLKQQ